MPKPEIDNSQTTFLPSDGALSRTSIDKLTPDQLDEVVKSVRERRLAPIHVYKSVLGEAKKRKLGHVEKVLNKHLVMFEKELAAVDKALQKLEKRSHELAVVKFQMQSLCEELGGQVNDGTQPG